MTPAPISIFLVCSFVDFLSIGLMYRSRALESTLMRVCFGPDGVWVPESDRVREVKVSVEGGIALEQCTCSMFWS